MARKLVGLSRRCPYCGREWSIRPGGSQAGRRAGGWAGFVQSSVDSHVSTCKVRTPRERRKALLRDLRRWEKNPPKTRITVDYNHPGLVAGFAESEDG